MVSTQWTRLVPPCARPTGMEESDPVNGWPQRALSLWDMMMMILMIEPKLADKFSGRIYEDLSK
jgi:hypothetical protein